MTKTVVCVLPRDTIERALRTDASIITDSAITYEEFIELTISMLSHIGIETVAGREEMARAYWYKTMEVYGWMEVGDSTEESELIAYASFAYARYLTHHYPLYNIFHDREISFELTNGDIIIYGY